MSLNILGKHDILFINSLSYEQSISVPSSFATVQYWRAHTVHKHAYLGQFCQACP